MSLSVRPSRRASSLARRRAVVAAGAAFIVAAGTQCGGVVLPPSVQHTSQHSLSGLAAQRIVILPTYLARVAPALAWDVGRPADLARTLDADIVEAFEERGLRKAWIFPVDLERSFAANPTYATDPHALAEEPLRSPMLASDARLPEPLATQVRTLVALHDDARYVLAPVQLALEPAPPPATGGRGVLRLVLMDARLSSIVWIGDVTGAAAPAFGPVVTASVAARLASAVAP
jgi:hypothetical protein